MDRHIGRTTQFRNLSTQIGPSHGFPNKRRPVIHNVVDRLLEHGEEQIIRILREPEVHRSRSGRYRETNLTTGDKDGSDAVIRSGSQVESIRMHTFLAIRSATSILWGCIASAQLRLERFLETLEELSEGRWSVE